MLKVICGSHNHELTDILIGHPYANKLTPNEHFTIVNMTQSLVKLTNILIPFKNKSEDNVVTIKLVYNVRYANRRSQRGSRTEIQQLLMLLLA